MSTGLDHAESKCLSPQHDPPPGRLISEDSMNKVRFIVVIALAGILAMALLVAGCSKSSSPTSPAGGGGGASNTPFNSGSLTAPASFDHMFPVAGTVGYHCNFHQSMGMVGTVVVAAGGASSVTVTASGTSFSPASVTIMPGGTVHWSVTGGTHTVTSD
jgi:plastocyanin